MCVGAEATPSLGRGPDSPLARKWALFEVAGCLTQLID